MDIDLLKKGIFGMRLDRINYYSVLIDGIQDLFHNTFGADMLFVDKQVVLEHMGFFKIHYKYLPLKYEIFFESDRDIFTIEIYDSEGAQNHLYRIEKYESKTKMENVKNAINILKTVLEENDFCLYIDREGKLYRKKDQQYKRVKNLTELMGDDGGGAK